MTCSSRGYAFCKRPPPSPIAIERSGSTSMSMSTRTRTASSTPGCGSSPRNTAISAWWATTISPSIAGAVQTFATFDERRAEFHRGRELSFDPHGVARHQGARALDQRQIIWLAHLILKEGLGRPVAESRCRTPAVPMVQVKWHRHKNCTRPRAIERGIPAYLSVDRRHTLLPAPRGKGLQPMAAASHLKVMVTKQLNSRKGRRRTFVPP